MLTVEGFHEPVIPLLEVAGKTGAVAPLQIAGITLNNGVVLGIIVIVFVTIVKQPEPDAVNV